MKYSIICFCIFCTAYVLDCQGQTSDKGEDLSEELRSTYLKDVSSIDDSLLHHIQNEGVVLVDKSLLSTLTKQEEVIATLKMEGHSLKQRQTIFLCLIAFLLLSIGGLVYYLYQQARYKAILKKDLANQKEVNEQMQESVALNTAKVNLFTNISHELRSSLTLIEGGLNILGRHKNLPPEALSAVRAVQNQSAEMVRPVNDILGVLKEKTLDLRPKPVLFLLEDLMRFIDEKSRLLSIKKEIAFERVSTDSIIATSVFVSDVTLLTTIIWNLLDNAFKYTNPGGQVQIRYHLKGKILEVSVLDNGQGIPDTAIAHIFDRYYQVDDTSRRQKDGFGIGLSICKEYTHLLNGQIDVESSVGVGTTFRVEIPFWEATINQKKLYRFPLLTSPLDVIKPSIASSQEEIADNSFILIVEDNMEMCTYLKTLLEQEYSLLFAYNGKEVLRILERHRPMLIITDLMMPVMDGITMIEHIKNNKYYSQIPIMILSGKDSVLDEIKAARFGIEHFLLKPFKEEELKTMIYNLLYADDQWKEASLYENNSIEYVEDLKRSRLKTSKEQEISNADQLWVKKVEEKINPLITDVHLNVDKICEVLEISPTHLTRQMKTLMGMTPKKYVNELRLLRGRRMLKNKEYDSVKAVAYSVGFKSEKVFSRNFKKRFGVYPSAYLN